MISVRSWGFGGCALLMLCTAGVQGQDFAAELPPTDRELLRQWRDRFDQFEKELSKPDWKEPTNVATPVIFTRSSKAAEPAGIVQPAAFKTTPFHAPSFHAEAGADQQQTFGQWLRAAEQGDPFAQFNVGLSYSVGQGVNRDYTNAAMWYERTTEPMDSFASYQLGWMFALGLGFERSHVQAIKYWHQAMAKGLAVAKRDLDFTATVVNGPGGVYAENVRMARFKPEGLTAYKGYKAAKRELQFDVVSFKDDSGYHEDVHVVDYTPNSLFYRTSDGTCCGEVKLASLPADLQQRFGYSSAKADQYNRKMEYERKSGLPDAIPIVLDPWIEEPDNAKAKIVMEIAHDYHKSHQYKGTQTGEQENIFVCGDMARDLWDMLETKGIRAKLRVGNVKTSMKSPMDANHVWVMAEVSPEKWLAVECTGGYVVYFGQNDKYYRGPVFSTPNQQKECEALWKDYFAALEKDQVAENDYKDASGEYDAADDVYWKVSAGFKLSAKRAVFAQRRRDLSEVIAKLKALLGEKG